ncbi:MAG: asparaginase [Proteobacteria bacterium]|nr:asparaginase [Pseudomonadota bacterium]
MKIKILTTGGTIDKIYFDKKSEYEVGPPYIANLLSEINVNLEYSIESLFRKDSLDITEEDRVNLRKKINEDKHKKIIITHGTDTMTETGMFLSGIKGKTIVLTGAMEPAKFKTSDAVFNIGCAIGAVQTLSPGVYIAMNGRIYSPFEVIKNLVTGKFEEIVKA